MFKKYAVFVITASVLLTMALFISACEKGDLKPNVPPRISITSYAGADTLETAELNDAILFQQTLYWNAYDPDGSVVGYAYRVLNENDEPIATPGNESIDIHGEYTPAVLKAVDAKYGWIYRLPAGITDPNKNTIWTDRVSAVINFPANIDGDSANVVSRFDVVAIDNRGDISNIATKYFHAESHKPVVFASTSKGTFEKEENGVMVPSEVGQGFKLVFTMNDSDPYVGAIPWYFEYQIARYPVDDSTFTTPLDELVWFDTKDSDKVNEVILTASSSPALRTNYDSTNTTRESITVLRVCAVDLAGIKSDVKTYKFFVNGKYYPQTLIYHKKCYALSDNHYVENQDDAGTEVVPFMQTPSGYKIARPFYLHPVENEDNGELNPPTKFLPTAICNTNNEKTKIWLRWGYRGEFEGNDPDNKKVSIPRDSTGQSGIDYQTEISYYLLQLDGTRYQFGPLKDDATQARMGNTDPNWLKVPAGHDISQKINVGDLEPGRHVFKVKVEDLQGKQDPTPEVFEFEIVRPKPLVERSGALIITSETSNAMTEQIKDFYVNTISELLPGEPIHFVRRAPWVTAIANLPNTMRLFSNNPFAPSFLQQYKYVIYYKDFQPNESTIADDAVTFKSFLNLNGTLVLSGGDNIAITQRRMLSVAEYFFSSHFGMPRDIDNVLTINPQMQYQTKPYIKAVTSLKNPPFGDLSVNFDPDTQPIPLIITNNGLSTISYFKNVDPQYALYKTVSKQVGEDPKSPQTIDEYNEYNDKVIALVKENGTLAGEKGKGYLFAFPISVMDKTDAKLLLGNIIK